MLGVKFGHHLFAWTIHADPSCAHHNEAIKLRQDGCAVRDNENGRATRLHMHDGLGQRLLAGFVEVGVRLIEDNQARRAVDGAGQSDSLTLTTREVDAVDR